jgi:hypothetical protein
MSYKGWEHERAEVSDGYETNVLLPLPEPRLLALDLFGEALTKGLFFLFELGVIRLLHTRFTEFPGLHLLLTVVLIVNVFSGGNQVEHVRAN